MQLRDAELRALLPRIDITVPTYAEAFDPDRQIQPASIDLRVDKVLWKPQAIPFAIDLTSGLGASILSRRPSYKTQLGPRGKFKIKPGEIIMTRTLEKFSVPSGYAAEIYTRSSFGRLGLLVTFASYINPGYRGHMPLQIKNLGTRTIWFNPFISVCQIVFHKLSGEPEHAYGAVDLRSKYTDDDGGPSRWWMDDIIKSSQDALGTANIPDEDQKRLLAFILGRDLSTQLRFDQFLKRAKAVDLESADAALDAFSRSERVAYLVDRVVGALPAVVLALIGLSVGALFSTPFNESKYGALHLSVWAFSFVVIVLWLLTGIRRWTARNADFLLPSDLAELRARNGVE